MVDFDKAANAFDVSAFSVLSVITVPVGEAMLRWEGSRQLVPNPQQGRRDQGQVLSALRGRAVLPAVGRAVVPGDQPDLPFTIDGRRDSYYDAEYVAKIKRMERNGAVYQLVAPWADYLHGEDTLFKSRDERILFGSLLAIDADAAIDDKAWLPPPDPPAPAPADAGLLAGLWDEP